MPFQAKEEKSIEKNIASDRVRQEEQNASRNFNIIVTKVSLSFIATASSSC